MTHLKRIAAPRSWHVRRKEKTYITRSSPGPHPIQSSLPLSLVLKEFLHLTTNQRENKKILSQGKILIDGKVITDHRFPIGFMDLIHIPEIKQHYQMLYNARGTFYLKKTHEEAAKTKICKIRGKTKIKGNQLQLNLYDGKNTLIDNDHYSVDDSVIISLPDKKVLQHLPLERGCTIYLTGGKHTGTLGLLEEIKRFKSIEEDRIIIRSQQEKIETLKRYAFVVPQGFEP